MQKQGSLIMLRIIKRREKVVGETVKDVSETRIFSGRTELQFRAAQLQTRCNTSESDGHVISTQC